ncbi:MAG: sigma-70 family RNA polymerase sigma factor [Alphaproteobacteria bacterium]|jgi:RNA polymerase sigma factor (sigma-70 family)
MRPSFDQIAPHLQSLRRYALVLLRYDETRADDLVQDCVVRAMSRWHLWRQPGNLRAWLFTIMHNIYVNDVARAAVRPAVVELTELTPGTGMPAGQGDRLALRDVANGLDRLSDDQRQTVLLVGLEGFSYEEAAEITGVPIGTVMSRLSRGRQRLRDYVENGEDSVLRRVK